MNHLSFKILFSILTLFTLTACQPDLVRVDQTALNKLENQLEQLNLKLDQQNQTTNEELNELVDNQKLTESQLAKQEKTLKSINYRIYQLVKTQPKEDLAKNNDADKSQAEYKILNDKLIVGSVEKIHFTPSNWVLDARIDTGATTSSIDAREITEFERDGKNWVKFTLVNRELKQNLELEMPIKRVVTVSQASVKEPIKRLVVEFLIKIGNLEVLTDFTLNDRDHMEFPVLIGRTLLRDIILVDVSQQYLAPLVLENENLETAEKSAVSTENKEQK